MPSFHTGSFRFGVSIRTHSWDLQWNFVQGPSGTIRQPTDLIISGGAEVAMVVGLASGRISILEPIQTIHHATKDAKGLLQALHQVAQRRPLAQILSASPRAISMNTSCKELRGDDCKAMRAIVEECKNNVDNLKKVFQNVEAPPDASRVQHYRQVTRALGKGARVESLMKVILEDMQRWVENHGIRAVTNEQVKQLGSKGHKRTLRNTAIATGGGFRC